MHCLVRIAIPLTIFSILVVGEQAVAQDFDPQQTLRNSVPYLKRRASFHTRLTKKAAAPTKPKSFETPNGWFPVTYPSTNGLELKAWLHIPKDRKQAPFTAVVYFHGNFALHDYDFRKTKPFVDEGYVVLMPTLRGENGNAGHHEMFFGEVEDGMNAIRWLARQDFVDKQRIHTFGHSAGGVISTMLSLHENIPVRNGGSSGGLYGSNLFDLIKDKVPFDLKNPEERNMRILAGNIRWMQRPHVAFVGDEDAGLFQGVKEAEQELETLRNPKLKIVRHPGTHNSALPAAIQQYVKMIKAAS